MTAWEGCSNMKSYSLCTVYVCDIAYETVVRIPTDMLQNFVSTLIWQKISTTMKVKTVMECSRTSCELCDYPYGKVLNLLVNLKSTLKIHRSQWNWNRNRTVEDIHITYKPFHKWSFSKISPPKLRKFQRLLFKTIICILFLFISPLLCYFAYLSRQRSRSKKENEYSWGRKFRFENFEQKVRIYFMKWFIRSRKSHFLYKFSGRIAAICFIDCVIIAYCYKMCRYFR